MKNIGSRAEVFHDKALKTSGGLRKSDLKKNKNGYIVSAKKSKQAKNEETNPLLKLGYQQNENSKTFGPAPLNNKQSNNKQSNNKQSNNKAALRKKSKKLSLKKRLCDFFKL